MSQEAMKQLEESRAVSEMLSKSVVQTIWHGRIDGALMRQVCDDMRRILERNEPHYWYSDTSLVGTYSVDIRKPATELIALLKAKGVQEIVGVVPSPAVRMLSTSLTFVVGLKLKMFANSQEAREYLSHVKG